MALDEFLIWVNADAPYKDVKSYHRGREGEARRAQDGRQPVEGHRSDPQSHHPEPTGAKFTYMPFKSGSEAAVQLAGAHIDANVNNPNENIGQWKAEHGASTVRVQHQTHRRRPQGRGEMAWSDIPTCKESGHAHRELPDAAYGLATGGVPDDAVAFYVELLRKAQETPDWRDYMERTSQTDRFLTARNWDLHQGG